MDELDPVIHAPKRLRIMALLATADDLTFARIQDQLRLGTPDLSKQIKTLHDAGYLRTKRSGRGPGSQTWVGMTREGARAYRSHVRALRALLDDADSTTESR